MVRTKLTMLAATGMTCLLTAFLVASQSGQQGNKPMQGHDMPMASPKDGKTKSPPAVIAPRTPYIE